MLELKNLIHVDPVLFQMGQNVAYYTGPILNDKAKVMSVQCVLVQIPVKFYRLRACAEVGTTCYRNYVRYYGIGRGACPGTLTYKAHGLTVLALHQYGVECAVYPGEHMVVLYHNGRH